MRFDLFRASGIRAEALDNVVLVYVGLGHQPANLTASQAMELGAALLGFGLAVKGKNQEMVDDIIAVIQKHTGGAT